MSPDRIQARIRAQLELGAPDLETHVLAAELAALASRARERLEQCAALIRIGNEQAALQAAEAEPPLLDLCAWIGFADADRWARLCRERGLPVPAALDDAAIAAVEQLYGKPIDENHPLYRDYRQAIRERDDARALGVLRAIARVNPGDANAQAELARLGDKFARASLARIRERLAAGDLAEVDRLAAEVERLGAAALAGDPDWETALARRREWHARAARGRLAALAAEAGDARRLGNPGACAAAVAAARSLARQSGALPEAADEARLAEAESWAGALLAAEQAEAAARAEAEALASEIEVLRRDLRARADSAALRRAGAWLGRAEAVAGRLEPALLQEARALRAEAHRRVNRRHTLGVALALAVLLAALASGYGLLADRQRDASEREALAAAAALKDAGDLEGAARELESLPTGRETSGRTLRQELDALRGREQELAREAEALAALAAAGVTRANHAEARRRALALRAAADSLPRALGARVLSRAGDLSGLIERADAERAAIEPEIRALLRELAGATGTRERLARPDAVERLAAEVRERVAAAGDGLASEVSDQALATAERALERLAREREADAQGRRLAEAADIPAYLSHLRTLAAGKPETAATRAAGRLLAKAEALDGLPRPLLGLKVGAMWDALPGSPGDAVADPAEAIEAARVVDDPAIRPLRRYILQEHTASGVRARGALIVSGTVSREVRRIASGTETVTTAQVLRSSGDLVQETWSLRRFDNGTSGGEELAEALALPDTDYLRRLARLVDPSSRRATETPLALAERVRRERGSALLRGYHLQQLLALAARRPGPGGLVFSPSALADARELRGMTQNTLGPTDFLFPERWADVRVELEKLLARPAAPYAAEARHLRALLGKVRDGGLRLAGRVDEAGEPVLREEAGSGLYIGLDSSGQPGVLFQGDGSGELRRLRDPMPMSPLLRPVVLPSEAAASLGAPPSGMPTPAGGWDELLKGTDL